MRIITRVLDPFTGRKDTFIRLPFGRIIMIGG